MEKIKIYKLIDEVDFIGQWKILLTTADDDYWLKHLSRETYDLEAYKDLSRVLDVQKFIENDKEKYIVLDDKQAIEKKREYTSKMMKEAYLSLVAANQKLKDIGKIPIFDFIKIKWKHLKERKKLKKKR